MSRYPLNQFVISVDPLETSNLPQTTDTIQNPNPNTLELPEAASVRVV